LTIVSLLYLAMTFCVLSYSNDG